MPSFRVPVRRGRLRRLRNHRLHNRAPTIVARHHRRGGDRPIHGPSFEMSTGGGASFSSGGRQVQPTPQRVDDVVAVLATVVPHRRWRGTMAGDDEWRPSLLDESSSLQGGTIASGGKTKKNDDDRTRRMRNSPPHSDSCDDDDGDDEGGGVVVVGNTTIKSNELKGWRRRWRR